MEARAEVGTMDVLDKRPRLLVNTWWHRGSGGLRRAPAPALLLFVGAVVFFLGRSWLQPASPAAAAVAGLAEPESCAGFYRADGRPRRFVFSITDFGGVGDGRTSNTAAFRRSVDRLREFEDRGGAQLNVPPGIWLTGSFNLTSNFTLFLERGAVILGSQEDAVAQTLLALLFSRYSPMTPALVDEPIVAEVKSAAAAASRKKKLVPLMLKT